MAGIKCFEVEPSDGASQRSALILAGTGTIAILKALDQFRTGEAESFMLGVAGR